MEREGTEGPNPLRAAPSRFYEPLVYENLLQIWSEKQPAYDLANLHLELINGLPKTSLVDCLFKIVADTSAVHYRNSSVGWSGMRKLNELRDPAMTFVLIKAGMGNETCWSEHLPLKILGFVCFKLEFDYPPHELDPVIYIYELHVSPAVRKHGFASFLMAVAERAAKYYARKTMLTVFTQNISGVRFYKKLGYVVDDASPRPTVLRRKTIEPDYLIMSKHLDNGPAAQPLVLHPRETTDDKREQSATPFIKQDLSDQVLLPSSNPI